MCNHSKIGNKEVGKYGENSAVRYLIDNGFTVLSQNVRLKIGEVDIFAAKEGVFYVVEVKSASSVSVIDPINNFTKRKVCKLKLLAKSIEIGFMSNNVVLLSKLGVGSEFKVVPYVGILGVLVYIDVLGNGVFRTSDVKTIPFNCY